MASRLVAIVTLLACVLQATHCYTLRRYNEQPSHNSTWSLIVDHVDGMGNIYGAQQANDIRIVNNDPGVHVGPPFPTKFIGFGHRRQERSTRDRSTRDRSTRDRARSQPSSQRRTQPSTRPRPQSAGQRCRPGQSTHRRRLSSTSRSHRGSSRRHTKSSRRTIGNSRRRTGCESQRRSVSSTRFQDTEREESATPVKKDENGASDLPWCTGPQSGRSKRSPGKCKPTTTTPAPAPAPTVANLKHTRNTIITGMTTDINSIFNEITPPHKIDAANPLITSKTAVTDDQLRNLGGRNEEIEGLRNKWKDWDLNNKDLEKDREKKKTLESELKKEVSAGNADKISILKHEIKDLKTNIDTKRKKNSQLDKDITKLENDFLTKVHHKTGLDPEPLRRGLKHVFYGERTGASVEFDGIHDITAFLPGAGGAHELVEGTVTKKKAIGTGYVIEIDNPKVKWNGKDVLSKPITTMFVGVSPEDQAAFALTSYYESNDTNYQGDLATDVKMEVRKKMINGKSIISTGFAVVS